jgi:protein SCO1/2
MSKKFIGYTVFFTVLTIAFFYFVFAGTDNWKAKLPTVSDVQPFSFINQDGKTITEDDLKGKVTVVEYFFTTCKGICPRMNNSMKSIYDQFKGEQDFLILAHTVQPEIDSVPRLKYYADSLKVDTDKWVFLTGRKDSLYKMARISYLLDDPKNNVDKIDDQFIHTQFFSLVDRAGQVRGGVYDGLKKDEMARLTRDIEELLKEKTNKAAL